MKVGVHGILNVVKIVNIYSNNNINKTIIVLHSKSPTACVVGCGVIRSDALLQPACQGVELRLGLGLARLVGLGSGLGLGLGFRI